MAFPRRYTKVESRLLNEWYKEKHWGKRYWTRIRVGKLPDEEQPQFFKSLRRWADMIIIDDDTVLLIEAKMRPSPGAIGQLEMYAKLFKETPEFEPHWDKPLQMVLLTAREDLAVRGMCTEKGIRFELFTPPWVADYEAEQLRLYGKIY